MRNITATGMLLALFSSQIAYGGKLKPVNDSSLNNCLQKANRLLDEALGFMQKYYYKKNRVQWDSVITLAKARLATSGNCSDYSEIISSCFRQINESHSFHMPVEKAAVYNNTGCSEQQPALSQLMGDIQSEILEDGIAYITVPWVSSTDPAVCTRIADSLQDIIARLDQQPISNWIIDLRRNTGGNCWPMLAGIGPLLGNGVCGYFVAGNEKVAISYKDGVAFQGRNARCSTSKKAYNTKLEKKTIIILTGSKTVSSGEIIALAFKGKEDVFFYGEPTAGYTTANATYNLSDNSMLVLTVCQEADRYGRLVEGKIMPDERIVADITAGNTDQAKSAAMFWLLSNRPSSSNSFGLK
jgi:hypothetical protein